jgi:hypothetical protein
VERSVSVDIGGANVSACHGNKVLHGGQVAIPSGELESMLRINVGLNLRTKLNLGHLLKKIRLGALKSGNFVPQN